VISYTLAIDGERAPITIHDNALTLKLTDGWATFIDPDGIAAAFPTSRIRSLIRTDDLPEEPPPPEPR
jgi:hypothetical protein